MHTLHLAAGVVENTVFTALAHIGPIEKKHMLEQPHRMIEQEAKVGLTPDRLTRVLWLLFLAPPVTWASHLLLSYSLQPTACEKSTRLALWLVSIVLILVPTFTGWRSFTLWQAIPDPYAGGSAGAAEEEEPRSRGRERFLAVGQSVPMFILRPCD